jgi:hypothetical protein
VPTINSNIERDDTYLISAVFSCNIVLFLLNPFVACFFVLATSLRFNYKVFINLLIINISGLFGLINITKLLESDLLAYNHFFLLSADLTLWEYLNLFSSEFVYYFLSYASYYLMFGSWELYIFTTTFISFCLVFKSVQIVLSEFNNMDVVTGIVIVALFYPIFGLSAHLLRNFIAAALVLYFITNYFYKNRNLRLILLASISIHASAALFLIIYFIPKKFSAYHLIKANLIILLGFFLIYVLINLEVFDPDQFYVYKRLMGFEGTFDNFYILLAMLVFISPCIILIEKIALKINIEPAYILLLLFVFLLGISLPNNSVIQQRILLYIYFIGIPIFLAISINRTFYARCLNVVLIFILTILFVRNLTYGAWSYDSSVDIITNTMFKYLD